MKNIEINGKEFMVITEKDASGNYITTKIEVPSSDNDGARAYELACMGY